MLEPDLDLGRRFLAEHPPPGRVLLCEVTGSHHYGFPSPDSDIDLKGVHVAPTRSLLGLSTPRDAHDRLLVFEGTECDLTSNEVGQVLRLVLRGNGNALERGGDVFGGAEEQRWHHRYLYYVVDGQNGQQSSPRPSQSSPRLQRHQHWQARW